MILLTSSLQSVMELIGVVLIFLVVLLLTYFTSKWIGGYQRINMKNKNMQIIESLSVGNNKYICLVKAGEVYLVVAVGKDEITMLAQLTKEQLTFDLFGSLALMRCLICGFCPSGRRFARG